MATITLKKIPDDLYLRLKSAAKVHHRSINSETLNCLETVLKPQRLPVDQQLARLRAVRPSLTNDAISMDEIKQAINEGRP